MLAVGETPSLAQYSLSLSEVRVIDSKPLVTLVNDATPVGFLKNLPFYCFFLS